MFVCDLIIFVCDLLMFVCDLHVVSFFVVNVASCTHFYLISFHTPADTFGLTPFPELDHRPARQDQPVSKAVSLESLVGQGQQTRSVTPVATQTTDLGKPTYLDSATGTDVARESRVSAAVGTEQNGDVRRRHRSSSAGREPRHKTPELGAERNRRKDKDTEVLYREALEGAKRAEEFKFRVKFDHLLVELHQTIHDKDGLASCFTSPAYGEVMLIFRDKVKELLKSFTQRLTLAHESFDPNAALETTVQRVKQDVSKFIEDLIGETLDLTSEEAVSDLSSLSDEAINDTNSFEDLKAQAVVTKLLENHRREISGLADEVSSHWKIIGNSNHVNSHEHLEHNSISGTGSLITDSLLNGYHNSEKAILPVRNSLVHKTDLTNDSKTVHDNVQLLNNKNSSQDNFHSVDKPDENDALDETDNNNQHNEVDIEKDFEELKEFVRKTQTAVRPKVEAVEFDDSQLCEVREEPLAQSKINHNETREEFLTRYSVFDKVHNTETDFSQFENIDFFSNEIDPDLLSMNLEIIPEETEEELEQEEDEEKKWRSNWIFKGSNQNDSMGRQVNKTIPRPEISYMPKIASRNIEYMSEPDLFSPSDLDGSDDEENTYYANTSKELARISSQRNKYRSGNTSDDSDFSVKLRSPLRLYDDNAQDFLDGPSTRVDGPLIAPTKQELKFLQDLIPADNDDPKFVVPPESVTIQEGEPVKFSCRVTGTQPVDVFWYREGEEVEEFEESEDVEISNSGDKYNITLYNISKAMAGQYMCIALNEKGKATQYLVVTVKSNKHDLKKPEFIKGLKDVEVTEGQSVKFRVKVKGYPPPRISWYKDGTLLKSSKTCRLEKFGNRDYILTIDYATMNDDAEYTVCARNVAGEIKASAQVIVEPQTDAPVKKQRHSSMTTSGASDSDSDKMSSRSSLLKFYLSSAPKTSTAASRNLSLDQENLLPVNHLDSKLSLAQRNIEEESEKMKEDAKRDQSTKNSRLFSPSTLNLLEAAEEIIQQEKSSSDITIGKLPDQYESSSGHIADHLQAVVDDLGLPDTLDDFPLSSHAPIQDAPVKSTLEFSIRKTKPVDAVASSSPKEINRPKSEHFTKLLVSNGDHLTKLVPNNLPRRDFNQNDTINIINTSFDSGKGASLQDISTSLASSFSSNSSSRDNIESDLEQAKAPFTKLSFSRDFEVQQNSEKKKWSVNLDPFSPQAEIVNLPNSINKPTIEVNNVDINLTSIKGDSQASSPRQSIDSGVSVSSKLERPASVHMVGHTSEDEVPESRTEFNTDGSIELPSVNKLRAMFSNVKEEDLGDGNFKRGESAHQVSHFLASCIVNKVHSITARSVPKEKLEKLRASNQKTELSSSTPNLLCVPGETPKVSSTATLKLGSSSTSISSPVPLAPSTLDTGKQQPHTLTYIDVKADKEPVLIYPETDITASQQHHPHLLTSIKAPQPPVNNQGSQPKLLIHTPASKDADTVKKSTPRIKSGCISARTAFWERKMIDGSSVNDNEFPDMLEDGDS
uniref:Ig-like domain-containing protein n=1 Tax=Biomphalaria glabrata TaxID=6526 RepID=A0A2C9KQJ6_BIOGL